MVIRTLAKEYGYTPQQIAELPDDALYDLIPGYAEADLKEQARIDKENVINEARSKWFKDHPGVEPDYKRDLVPIINAR